MDDKRSKQGKKSSLSSELGHAYGEKSIMPFDFKGKVDELPMSNMGQPQQAFDYEY